jgi:hypothetical protein
LPEATLPPTLCPAAPAYENGKILKADPYGDTDKIAHNKEIESSVEKNRTSTSRKKLYIILAVVIITVIAVVVGSVVGVLKRQEQSRATNASDGSNNAQDGNTTTGNLVWNQTSLAVTGWRYNDEKDFSMR